MNMRRLVWSIAIFLLTACNGEQSLSTATSPVIDPTPPPGMPGSSGSLACCMTMVADGLTPYPSPLPSDMTLFLSQPDPSSGIRFSGRVAFTYVATGIVNFYAIIIENDGPTPIPIRQNDFIILGTPFGETVSRPLRFMLDEVPFVPPQATVSIRITIEDHPDTLIWIIGSGVDQIAVPFLPDKNRHAPTTTPQAGTRTG